MGHKGGSYKINDKGERELVHRTRPADPVNPKTTRAEEKARAEKSAAKPDPKTDTKDQAPAGAKK